MKIAVISVILCLLLALVAVQSQTAPYITFEGHRLSNHSYVNLSQVGGNPGKGVQCHTDLVTCCSSAQGQQRGDWYYPNGTRLPISFFQRHKIVQIRRNQEVELHHYEGGNMHSGVYRCDIETNAANNGNRETVFAGLYYSGGDVMILDNMQLFVDYDLFGEKPQFTLTCISTGGPATTVTWTRDFQELSGGLTVLSNTVTSQYIHTLTVTGTKPGRYNCTVSNNKPSSASKNFTVQAASSPTNLMAVQRNATSIQVSWTPPTPLGYTFGYKIFYNGSSVNVSCGSTDDHLLIGLYNGASYTISIVGTSQHFPSEHVNLPSMVPLVPDMPTVMVSSTTATTISLTWSVPSGSVVDSYTVSWESDTSRECSGKDMGNAAITDDSTSYSIVKLEEGSSYTIQMTVTNKAGSVFSDPVMGMTMEAVPSAPPTSVSASNVTSTSVTLQWGAVDCTHRNGKITGYSVLYGVQDSGITQTINVSGATTKVVISGLTTNTTYSIAVAAVNSAGIGKYSTSKIAMTNSKNNFQKVKDRGASSVGGALGGGIAAFILAATIVVLVITGLLWWKKRTKAEMQYSSSKVAKKQNAHVATCDNVAYGYVKRVGNTQHETNDMATGAAISNQEPVYDTIPN